VQWTINSKNAIKRTQYKNIQQLIVQCCVLEKSLITQLITNDKEL